MLCLVKNSFKIHYFPSTMWKFLLVILFHGSLISARTYFRVCQPPSVDKRLCDILQRGNSEVKCEFVLDGADCALKLVKNEVDFGVFTVDDLYLVYQDYPNAMRLLYEIRDKDKEQDDYRTQMVALTSANYQTFKNFAFLKGGGLCHPGFSESQLLSDYFLKRFEREVIKKDCNKDLNDLENELVQLKNFFGRGCRPGAWVPDKELDKTLKKKYPQLCELCDNASNCSYNNNNNHGHSGALRCLKENRGNVAYVAVSHVQEFLDSFPSKVPIFEMLCPNDTVLSLNLQNPCAWVKESWDVIGCREDVMNELFGKLERWLNFETSDWTNALREILLGKQSSNVQKELPSSLRTIGAYLGREFHEKLHGVPYLVPPENPKCGKEMRWCTTSEQEKNKCQWVANEAQALGITPKIVCERDESPFTCMRSISQKKSDLMTIDSNYGYVARKLFGLSTVLYADNKDDKINVVLAVIKDTASPKFRSLQDLKGKTACFPEYGGISWMSFINNMFDNKLVDDPKTCDFKKVASDIFSKACVPRIRDGDHLNLQRNTKANVDSLCALCPHSDCRFQDENEQDNGAFRCIEYGEADIAFVKPKNLNDSTAFRNEHKYRVLCKNGTLAMNTGFDVGEECAWSVTIDSEIVARKDISKVEHSNMAHVLLKLNSWLGPDSRKSSINIYKQFNGTKDLLFKESTVGLESSTSTVHSVTCYKKLMSDTEKCFSSASLSFISLIVLLVSFIFNQVL